MRRSSPAPVLTALDRSAAITPARRPRTRRNGEPRPRRASANLWRLRYYLMPFRARFLATALFAAVGTGATIVVPLVTKAVIDGPIAHSDQRGLWALGCWRRPRRGRGGADVLPPLGGRARPPIGTEPASGPTSTPSSQRLPMGFHDRWQSGQLLSRIMNDLSTIRRFLGFGLLFILIIIARSSSPRRSCCTCTGRSAWSCWPRRCPSPGLCLRNERAYTRLSRQVQDQTGDVASDGRGGRPRAPGDQGFRPAGAHVRPLRRAQRRALRHLDGAGAAAVPVLDLPRRHPQPHPDHRAAARRRGRRPGPAHPGHAWSPSSP